MNSSHRATDLLTTWARKGLDGAAQRSGPVARSALQKKIDLERETSWELRFCATLGPGSLAVDIGAHIGMVSWLLAPRFSTVLAVEPNPVCLGRLHASMPDNVVVVGAASSDTAGVAELAIPVHNGRAVAALGSLRAGATSGENGEFATASRIRQKRVATLRLDDLVSEPVDVLKIDVEGFEAEALAGASRVLSDQPVVIIEAEERHRPGSPVDVRDRLAAHGLSGLFVVSGEVLETERFDPLVHQANQPDTSGVVPDDYAANFVYVPTADRDQWAERLRSVVDA